MAERARHPRYPRRARRAAVPDRHRLEPARGPSAHRRLLAQPARRGARCALDALAPVAARRVRGGRRRLSRVDASCTSRRASCWATRPARTRPARSPPACRSTPSSSVASCRSRSAARRSRSTCASRWAGAGSRSSAPIGSYADAFRARLRIRAARPRRSGRRGDLRPSGGLGGACRRRRPRAGRRGPVRAPRGGSREPRLRRRRRNRPERPCSRSTMRPTRSARWFADLIVQPPADDAWQPDRLEYRFACSAPVAGGDEVLRRRRVRRQPARLARGRRRAGRRAARRHRPGRRDRRVAGRHPRSRDLQRHAERPLLGVRGRPDELRRRLRLDDRPRAQLLFCEFALVYGNDWFLLPCDLPLGSLAHVRGLRVTTVFGESFWIEPAGADQDWQRRFSLFTLDRTDGGARRGGRPRAAADLAGRPAGRAARAGRR